MAEEMTVDGITVPISRPDKVLFPAAGITKDDLARYYADVSGWMLPWLRDRPVTLVRYPDGLAGPRFFQKNAPSYFPDWIRRVEVAKEGGVVEHVVCDKAATLVYLAGQACIEIHAFTSRVDKLDVPDQMVFDFDPPDGNRFADVRRAALWARDLLDGQLGLTSFVRTSGGRGLHVHLALNRRADFEAVREFAHRAAEVLARRHPDVITTEQRKDKRGARIYADVMRNAYAQTVAANYGVRARPDAPVATPLHWPEVEDDRLEPGQFTMATVRSRLDRAEDPWAGFTASRHGLTKAGQRLADLGAVLPGCRDYRSMGLPDRRLAWPASASSASSASSTSGASGLGGVPPPSGTGASRCGATLRPPPTCWPPCTTPRILSRRRVLCAWCLAAYLTMTSHIASATTATTTMTQIAVVVPDMPTSFSNARSRRCRPAALARPPAGRTAPRPCRRRPARPRRRRDRVAVR